MHYQFHFSVRLWSTTRVLTLDENRKQDQEEQDHVEKKNISFEVVFEALKKCGHKVRKKAQNLTDIMFFFSENTLPSSTINVSDESRHHLLFVLLFLD